MTKTSLLVRRPLIATFAPNLLLFRGALIYFGHRRSMTLSLSSLVGLNINTSVALTDWICNTLNLLRTSQLDTIF